MKIKRYKYKSELNKFSIEIQSFNDIVLVPIWLGHTLYIIKWNKPRTPKQMYRSLKWKLTRRLQNLEERFVHWYRYNFDDKPVYYTVCSIDCDCVEMFWYGKCEDYREYYDWMNDSGEWDWVEGRTHVSIVSEEEYLDNIDEPRKTFDHIMNAFEDGRGNNVIL